MARVNSSRVWRGILQVARGERAGRVAGRHLELWNADDGAKMEIVGCFFTVELLGLPNDEFT